MGSSRSSGAILPPGKVPAVSFPSWRDGSGVPRPKLGLHHAVVVLVFSCASVGSEAQTMESCTAPAVANQSRW